MTHHWPITLLPNPPNHACSFQLSACLQIKKGLSGTKAPDSSKPLGRVDPASKLNGKIFIADDTVYDVMLNLVDISKNSDKYFILQV